MTSFIECNCNNIQLDCLGKLKERLKAFQGLDYSPEQNPMEMAIRTYMDSSIKAGCNDPLHLLDHLNELYKKDMLFTDRCLIETARKIAQAAKTSPPSSTEEEPQPSAALSLPQLYSGRSLFHASICCRIVDTCKNNDFDTFFSKKDFQISHEFEEMSISRSGVGRYLIAKCKDLDYYIAFQGELGTAICDNECASIDIINGT